MTVSEETRPMYKTDMAKGLIESIRSIVQLGSVYIEAMNGKKHETISALACLFYLFD